MLHDEESKTKMLEKTQLKRDAYKVFGRSHDNLTADRDENIYNDYDFYQALLKDFLANNDSQYVPQDNQPGGEDDIYLDGADLGLTQKFLAKRQKLKEIQANKKKEVDRKASKNRKIRYIVHEKIVNFMTPLENLSLQEGKENIVTNLFGQKQVTEGEVKKNGKQNGVHKKKQAEDGVRLI